MKTDPGHGLLKILRSYLSPFSHDILKNIFVLDIKKISYVLAVCQIFIPRKHVQMYILAFHITQTGAIFL